MQVKFIGGPQHGKSMVVEDGLFSLGLMVYPKENFNSRGEIMPIRRVDYYPTNVIHDGKRVFIPVGTNVADYRSVKRWIQREQYEHLRSQSPTVYGTRVDVRP